MRTKNENENVIFRKVTKNRMVLSIGIVTLVKMVLRGVVDISFVIDLYGVMNQVKIGERNGVEMPNGDRIGAVKLSSAEAMIITASNKNRPYEDVSGRLEMLLNSIFKITLVDAEEEKKSSFVKEIMGTLCSPVTAKSVTTIGKEVSYV